MGKVLCIGHSAYDITMPVAEFPKENSKVRINETVSCSGGAATNACILLASWGYDTYLASVVGNDENGSKIETELKNLGVHLDYFEKSVSFSTTTSYILANQQNGSRTIVISRTKQIEASDKDFKDSFEALILDGEELSLSKKALEMYPDALSILDAGNLKPNIVALAKDVKYCIASRDFAEEYCKVPLDPKSEDDLIRCYEIMKKDFQNNIIITLGEKGSFTKDDAGYHIVPSIKVKAVDTTGSGDLYHGAFLYFIKEGYSLLKAMRLANITGALAAEGLGRSNSIPSLDDVLRKEMEDDLI